MKQISTSLQLIFLSAFLLVINYSCQKENIHRQPTSKEQTDASDKRPDDPGFAENDIREESFSYRTF